LLLSEWHVLGLDGDPVPGDPGQTRALASRLLSQAQITERNTNRLNSIASNGGELKMEGDYAPKFRDVLDELPGEIDKLSRAYRGCGNALNAYADSLAEAKSKAGSALRQGRDAHDRYQGALRELRSLLPPERQGMLSSGLGLNEFSLRAATTGLDEGVKARVEIVARRARTADHDRDLARRLADDAAELRGDAEGRCADAIGKALDSIKNKSWWEKAWDTVSAPFRSWDAFVDLCKGIALVAGVVALFISGPIGWALVAAALVAGAVVFANTAVKVAKGEAGWGDLALDALYLIPGSAGVIRLAVAGRGLLTMARGIPSAGRAFAGGLRNLRGAIPAIRSGLTSLRQSAVSMASRVVRGDPVDVATGEVVLEQVDLDLLGDELPGVLPLRLVRTHVSSYGVGRWFGRSWASTLDQRLEVDGAGVLYAGVDGVLLAYPTPTVDGPVLPEEGQRLPLSRTEAGGYRIDDPTTGASLHFRQIGFDGGRVLPLAAITDRNGARIDFDYDDDGALTGIRHSGGIHLRVETTHGLITALRTDGLDAGGGETVLLRYGYDGGGRLTEVINSSGQPLRFDYDPAGRLIRWQDRNGSWYRYAYDAHGRCTRTSGSDGCLDGGFSYETGDDDARVTVATDSFGHATTYHLNEALQVVRWVDPLGNQTSSRWDRYDRLLERVDPLGRTTSYAYDEAGNLIETARPDGTRVTAEYDRRSLLVALTEPDGGVWRRGHDERGNLTALTDPAGATTSYIYDQRGHLTSVTDALGNTRRVETDAAGLLTAVTNPLGAATRFERDVFGRLVAVTDPLGNVDRFGWTVEGRLAWHTLPDGATERFAYDAEGNLTEHVDALGQVSRIEVTHFDLPAARIAPDGTRFVYGYDTELRLVAVINSQGLTWRYDYDAAGSLIRETDFNGRVLGYGYDAAGQLVERTNGAGQTIRYRRDQLGRIVEQDTDGVVSTFAHDPVGRLVRATSPDADVVYERDPVGRVVAEACNGRTVMSGYDAIGRRVSRRTPSGAESAWEYDADDRPVAMRSGGRELRFDYDAAGREVERRFGGGLALAQTWDANSWPRATILSAGGAGNGRPESAGEARLIQRRSYTYRPDGAPAGVEEHLGGSRRFDLDAVGQVTAVRGDGWAERYAYDPAGNVTDATWPVPAGAAGERAYAGARIARAGAVSYEYDEQGRVVRSEQRRPSAKPAVWRYTWDAADRLTEVTTPEGQRWRYRYDAFGRRIAKQRLDGDGEEEAVEQVEFVWDGVLLAEQTHSGKAHGTRDPDSARTTVWDWEPSGFRPVSQTEYSRLRDAPQTWVDERFYAIVTDLAGTPTELVDLDGEIAWRAQATLWGTMPPPEPGAPYCPLRFSGQYYDPETGLHYNFYRYYDPATGRYQSNDVLGLAASTNPQRYVANPTREVDPLGLAPYSVNRVKGLLGRAGMSVRDYDIVKIPNQIDPLTGRHLLGHSPHTGAGLPHLGPRGRPLINVTPLGLADRETAVRTIFHEIYHHQTFARTGVGGTEAAAEDFGIMMWKEFLRRTGG
jgi:RHS repeat-associated protein